MAFRSSRTIVLCLLGLLLVPLALLGQTEKGAITGIVADSQRAVIVGANVTITKVGTNTSQSYLTTSEGVYEAPFLSPGHYQVTVSAPDFSTSVVNDIILHVGDRVRVDITLQVGKTASKVEVTASEPLIQSETASIGQVIDNKTLEDLPNPGHRNIYSFILLESNTTQPPGGNAPAFRLESGGSFAISGGRPSSVTFKVDGLSNTDPAFGTPNVTPSLDSIQEFKIQNNAYSAEFEGVGQVNVATKSGTNQIHGSLFEFLRNDRLQPRNPIAPLDSSGRPGRGKLRFNQFGGTVGGPVWIPKIYNGKDKTFFFFSYEGLRTNTLGPSFGRVLTAAERAGDFSSNLGGCAMSGGQPIPLLKPNGTSSGECVRVGQIFDPATTIPNPKFNPSQPTSPLNPQFIRQPFAGNVIPSNRISSAAQQIIAAQLPLPNNPGGSVETNFIGSAGAIFTNNQTAIRVDHVFSLRDTVFGRVTIQNNTQVNKPLIPFTSKNINNKGRVISFTWNHVFNPRMVNEFRLGYVRGIFGDSVDEEIDPEKFGIKNTFLKTLPRFSLSAGNINFGGTVGSASILAEVQNTYQLADNFSWSKGRHQIKFGGKVDYNRFQNGELGFGSNGTVTFSGIYSTNNSSADTTRSTPNSIADYLLGLAQSSDLNSPTPANLRNRPWALYAQDDWKVSSRITLNLGLRWEIHQPFSEHTLGGSRFDFSNGGRLIVADPEVARLANSPLVVCCTGQKVVPTHLKDFAPRVGLAIRPFQSNKLVVRVGYGMFYSDQTAFFTWRQYEPLRGNFFNGLSGDFNNVGATIDNLFPSNDFSQQGVTPFFPSNVPRALLNNQPVVGASALGDNTTPRSQQWSLSIQREIRPNMVVEITYAGSNSKHLPTQFIFNQPTASPLSINFRSPDPAANPFLRRPFPNVSLGSFVVTNILQSNYNAMTLKVEKRFSKGYSFLSNYTWSKAIDQGSEVFQLGNTFGIISDNRNINRDRGASTFDVQHRWVTSGIVELPFGRGKPILNRGGWVDKLVGGFQVSGVLTVQSGFPFTPLVRNRLAHTGFALSTERGDLVGDPSFSSAQWQANVQAWQQGNGRLFLVNPAAININYAPGTFGNIPRNFFRTPYGRNLDLSISKTTQIKEQAAITFRAEILGVTNERLHSLNLVQSVCANVCLTNPLVGSIPDRKFLFNPRIIQLSARVTF